MKIGLALASVLVALGLGCAGSVRFTAGNPATETPKVESKAVDVEQMVQSVPLVFYAGSAGAGVLYEVNGKIGMVTAAHVIADGDVDGKDPVTYATKPIHIIGYRPGTETIQYTTSAKLVSISPDEDWAVLEIVDRKEGMAFCHFSDHLPRIGQEVWAVGSPMFDAGTLSRGIVCHPQRTPAVHESKRMQFIHTDAAGTLGSSGGGLFTSDGLCVGIIVRKNPMNDTMYAVPTRTIHEALCGMFLPPDPMPPFVE